MAESIAAGKYIFERVAQLGIRHVFGVPGDFNCEFKHYSTHSVILVIRVFLTQF
jgi:indolepyruvate decarboxylase